MSKKSDCYKSDHDLITVLMYISFVLIALAIFWWTYTKNFSFIIGFILMAGGFSFFLSLAVASSVASEKDKKYLDSLSPKQKTYILKCREIEKLRHKLKYKYEELARYIKDKNYSGATITKGEIAILESELRSLGA